MKVITLILGLLTYGFLNCDAATITVYGRNEGTTVTVKPDGSSVYEIVCNNWYNTDRCYTIEHVPVFQKLTTPQMSAQGTSIRIDSRRPIGDKKEIHTITVQK